MKMHGAGNDFVVIDRRAGGAPVTAALARAIGDRHRGIGFDQMAVIDTDPDVEAKLTFYNADGSEAAACGNATRCIARYLMEEKRLGVLQLRTERGVLRAQDTGDGLVRVNMGKPFLEIGRAHV